MIATIDTSTALARARELYSSAIKRERTRVLLCAGTGCIASGSLELYDRLVALVRATGDLVDVSLLADDCTCEGTAVVRTGCRGFCAAGPLVQIEPQGVLYTHVKATDAEEIMEAIRTGTVVDRLVYRDPQTGQHYDNPADSPFYRKQRRVVLAHCGEIDPESLEEYIAKGGYQAIAQVLHGMTPEQVCQEVLASGLRGRGGAGFPTGRKWDLCRVNKSDLKFVICNGDEGDPGAFMDRSVMEGDPHRVLEGLMVAAYAIGATEGIFYVRAEYPLAVRRLRKAIVDAEDAGLLGDNILGSGFTFRARVKEGAGAFVCGEETALMASVEGDRGMPRPKPPFPAQSGLNGKPTIINNVETLANIPTIILNGASWYKAIGTAKSAGTKTFALTGKITNTGLVEIPMGSTLGEMIFDIGGGIPDGKRFKAVQIGGPSGGCLTEQHLGLGLDYDSLQSAGAMVGSGGLVVLDEDNCIVEVARFFMQFIQNESCGKCVACREGTKQMLGLLQKVVDGRGTIEDIDLLEELALVVKDASLCMLGKTAANPVLTTLRYFREEYMAHVRDRRCPAHNCQAFKEYFITADLCKGCGRCVRVCPAGAISGTIKQVHTINQELCARCGACIATCKFAAIEER